MIIAAGGIGQRMGGNKPKQFLEIAGMPIICHTLRAFQSVPQVQDLVVVLAPNYVQAFQQEVFDKYNFPRHWKVVPGGSQRQDSVNNGLKAISETSNIVLVHDAARPFITKELILQVANIASKQGAAILACPIKETVKLEGSNNDIVETIDRSKLWAAQTPQGFTKEILTQAMQQAKTDSFLGTDDASLVERLGRKVQIIEGDPRNIKITTPEDLIIAEAIAKHWYRS